MTNKLELFKEEDLYNTGHLDHAERANLINSILNERLSVGHVKEGVVHQSGFGYIYKIQELHHSHRIFYLTQPIVEEKKDCGCVEFKRNVKTFELAGFDVKQFLNNNCPNCGESLK